MPKRSSERRRRNKDGVETLVINLDEAISGEVEIPAPPLSSFEDEEGNPVDKDGNPIDAPKHSWHPQAEQWYLSLTASGQAIFMEPSDWATAYALAEMLSRELKPKPMVVTDADGGTSIEWVIQPVNGAVMNAFLKGAASLMVMEGDRRKLRIELERKKRMEEAAAGDKVVDIVARREDAFKRA